MDYPKFIVSSQREEFISIQRIKADWQDHIEQSVAKASCVSNLTFIDSRSGVVSLIPSPALSSAYVLTLMAYIANKMDPGRSSLAPDQGS